MGLGSYWTYFKENGYTKPQMLEDLKSMDTETLRKTLEEELKISKVGHLSKMVDAIKNMQYATSGTGHVLTNKSFSGIKVV